MTNATQPERNPKTHKAHRREFGWQIAFPLALGIVLILGLAAWTIVAAVRGGNVSQPADTSLIFLLIPTMVMAIIPFAIFAGLAYGIITLNKKLPGYFYQVQTAIQKVQVGIQNGADKLVAPMIRFKSIIAALGAIRGRK
ncbi:hypothetical protein AMJ86_09690 [bacterium SM23_57]|jgi:FtsH-binding integral membrane protein|nr:MAG: hypothetical protein AMJ86_09690 [bacterium SM23_57]